MPHLVPQGITTTNALEKVGKNVKESVYLVDTEGKIRY